MTVFDTKTDRYLERLGRSRSSSDWNDVLRRARRSERRSRRAHVAVAGGATATLAAIALALVGTLGGLGGRSIVDKAKAAVSMPVVAAPGTVEHILIQYWTDSRTPFIEYETWIAADGTWCRRTVEGVPGQRVADTRLTQCRTSAGVVELYLPATNEILRTRPGTPTDVPGRGDTVVPLPAEQGEPQITVRVLADGAIVVERGGQALSTAEINALPLKQRAAIKAAASQAGRSAAESSADAGPAPDWLREDVIEAFRRDAVREAGTVTLDGREYTKLLTDDGLNTVLVDPETGEAVAWIPSDRAFGVPTTVVRTRETLADNAQTRRKLSLTALHPDAVVRDVSAAERERALESQFPRG